MLPRPNGENSAERTDMHHVIDVDHMVKRIGGTTILDSLSFTVAAGTVLGVLGPNGAGKTTAVKSVAGLLPLDSGSVRVLGHDVRHDGGAVRQQLGLAGQYAPGSHHDIALDNVQVKPVRRERKPCPRKEIGRAHV